MVAVCPMLFLQPQSVSVEGKYESNIWMNSPVSVLRDLNWLALPLPFPIGQSSDSPSLTLFQQLSRILFVERSNTSFKLATTPVRCDAIHLKINLKQRYYNPPGLLATQLHFWNLMSKMWCKPPLVKTKI